VGPIKELVCKVNAAEISSAMRGWLANPPANLRAEIASWAAARGIECD
jgi:phosphotransferase system enzyme I (PtsP)